MTRYHPTSRPGARLPSGFLADGKAVFDELHACGLTLLAMGVAAGECQPMSAAASEVGVPLRILAINEPHLAALYGKRFVLVRPDQHVVWRGDAIPVDSRSIIETIRGAA